MAKVCMYQVLRRFQVFNQVLHVVVAKARIESIVVTFDDVQ